MSITDLERQQMHAPRNWALHSSFGLRWVDESILDVNQSARFGRRVLQASEEVTMRVCGPIDAAISATDELLEFFEAHAMPV